MSDPEGVPTVLMVPLLGRHYPMEFARRRDSDGKLVYRCEVALYRSEVRDLERGRTLSTPGLRRRRARK